MVGSSVGCPVRAVSVAPGTGIMAEARSVIVGTIVARMPIYEFSCKECGARFEELVGAGTESVPCRECGAAGTVRVLSPPGALPRLLKSPGGMRRQEARNAKLQADTRASFKAARERARAAKRGPGEGGK